MAGLDEAAIIGIFQGQLSRKRFVAEDVETFDLDAAAGNGRHRIVASMDTLVESTDVPPGMGLDLAARKSVVACVSDFAAKGVRPQYGVISVNIPRERATRQTCGRIARGFRSACEEYSMSIVGGDVNAGREIVFSVCAFGIVDCGGGGGGGGGGGTVTRGGASGGDLLFVTGPFGHTAAGLRVLLGKERGGGGGRERGGFAKRSVRSVTRPEPRLGFGLENRERLSSSMDSSDGLSATLNEMSRQSQKKFVVDRVPSADGLQEYAESRGLDPDDMVFYGGEEYEFAFTAAPAHRDAITQSARRLGTPVIEIGRVEAGAGVFVEKGGRRMRLRDAGWDHFGR